MTNTRGFWIGLALGFAFALGCGAGVTFIPPARAQSTDVTRWEYLEISHGWDGGRWANAAGLEGWELVQLGSPSNTNRMFFRRPLP